MGNQSIKMGSRDPSLPDRNFASLFSPFLFLLKAKEADKKKREQRDYRDAVHQAGGESNPKVLCGLTEPEGDANGQRFT